MNASYAFDCISIISPTYYYSITHIIYKIPIAYMYNITRFTIICEFVTRPCAVLFVVDYNDATT